MLDFIGTNEYQRTQALYYGGAPTFDQIIKKIRAVSDKL